VSEARVNCEGQKTVAGECKMQLPGHM
jgi:hypothetical protein